MSSDRDEGAKNHYEHAGTWDCDVCESDFEVENKLDPLEHVLEHCVDYMTDGGNDTRGDGHDGYRRRKDRLRWAGDGQ